MQIIEKWLNNESDLSMQLAAAKRGERVVSGGVTWAEDEREKRKYNKKRRR